jgi:hypothetical protein
MIPEKCAAVFRKDHAQNKSARAAKKSPPVRAGEKFKGGSAINESADDYLADSAVSAIGRKTTAIDGVRMLASRADLTFALRWQRSHERTSNPKLH